MRVKSPTAPGSRLWFAGVVMSAALLTACGAGSGNTGAANSSGSTGTAASGTTTAAAAKCPSMNSEQISFWDQSFDTIDIENAIAEFIVTNGYCYPTKTYKLTSAVGNKSLVDGQLDVDMEMWRYNFIDWYTKNTKAGTIKDLGQIYEKSTQGFYIPQYTATQYPQLKSVSQLKGNASWFKDPQQPSKGLFINCQIGWHCHVSNIVKFTAYGLASTYHIETPGSEGAEKAAIMGAYDKHQNFVFYWWAPTALLGQIKVVQLQEPKYTTSCNKLEASIWTETNAGTPLATALTKVTPAYGCGYQAYGIHKGVNAKWATTHPQLVAFLKKMDVRNQPIEDASAYYEAHNKNAEAAAMYFFGKYQKEWESWLPATQVARVKVALAKNGVKVA